METLLMIAFFVFALVIGLALGGFLFGLAVRIVCGFQPPLLRCVFYIIIIAIIQAAIGAAIGAGLSSAGVTDQLVLTGVSLLLNIGINPLVIGAIVKDEDETSIGYIKGLLVYLVNLLISIVLVFVCVGIPLLVFGGFAAFTG